MTTSNANGDSRAPKREPLKPPHRRLVLMFDGTGNQRVNLSNVARMFEAIDDSTPEDYEPYVKAGPGGPCVSCGVPVLEPDRQPVQMVKYLKGVGTDFLGHLSGLGFGYGLSANVIAGYVWLSNNYREGDEVFVFGFSRGAFSARSLVSLVHRCGGVLKNVSVSSDNNPILREDSPVVVKAYAMYQAYVQTTDSEGVDKHDATLDKDFYTRWVDFKTSAEKTNCRIHRVTVKMLGVWDTVGAVGIPDTGMKVLDDHVYPLNRYGSKQYQFHGQGLSCIVENAYHALAIDEHRKHFAPTLWDQVTPENQEVKQVWFVGSHCNVGGGADMDDLLDPDDLWQYSYVWMQKHAVKHGLRFYWTYDSPVTQRVDAQGNPVPTRRVSLRKPEDSFSLFLSGKYKWFYGPFQREAVETNGSKLHWSVKDRIAVSAKLQGDKHAYRPISLFGKFGTRFTEVAPDMIEIQKLDTDKPQLESKTVWQIEADDAVVESSEPNHCLKKSKCNCMNDIVAPVKKSGFWSVLGY